MSNKQDRFQYQPWYIKLWRYRWYLTIPYCAIKWWIVANVSNEYDSMSFKHEWSMAKGMAQVKMNWLYDWDEIKRKRK